MMPTTNAATNASAAPAKAHYAAQDHEARVVVSEDRCIATLHIPADVPREQISFEFCKALIQDRGVEYTAEVENNLIRLIEQITAENHTEAAADNRPIEHVVARASEPSDGRDGWVQWTVEAPSQQNPVQDEPLNFYERSPYVMVEAEQVVGCIHPPTLGTDGRDVTGQTRSARAGKNAPWSFDDTIIANKRGELIAQVQGMLVRAGGKARITQTLDMEGCVDFSTGNVNFQGDVLVAKGIKDNFHVQATGNVEVRGLIEAAFIDCGRDLVATGGIAARQRGKIKVQGDLAARYLDRVCGEIAGNVYVDREVNGVQLAIDGNLIVGGASVLASDVAVGGRIEAGTIGSPAATPTRFILGALPSLARAATQLETLMERVRQRLEQVEHEQASLAENIRITPAQRERQTELIFEINQLRNLLERAGEGRQRIEAGQKAYERQYEVRIKRMLHPRVTFVIGAYAYTTDREIAGPLHLGPARDARAMLKQANAPAKALAELTNMREAA